MGEEGCLNPTLFGGRYLGMSVDQPKKNGILNWQLISNNFFWWFLDN